MHSLNISLVPCLSSALFYSFYASADFFDSLIVCRLAAVSGL